MTQISIRLPDQVVDRIDAEIAAGRVSSRAVYVLEACRIKEREDLYARELETLNGIDGDPYQEFAAMHQWVTGQPATDLGEPPEIAPLPEFKTVAERSGGKRQPGASG